MRVGSRPRQMRPHVDAPSAPHFRVPSGTLSLCESILDFPVNILNDRSDSFSTFNVVGFDRSFMRCQHCTTRTTSSLTASLCVNRKHMWSAFHHKLWNLRSRSFFVRCDSRCFTSRATICHCVPHKPSQFVRQDMKWNMQWGLFPFTTRRNLLSRHVRIGNVAVADRGSHRL